MTVERKVANIRKKFVLFSLGRIFLLFIFYWIIGISFNLFLSKCLLAKSLHFLFRSLGWCGGGPLLALITLSLFDFDFELAKMMDSDGPSVGRSNSGVNSGWTSLFRSTDNSEAFSSTDNSEASVNQGSNNHSNPPEKPPFERFPYEPDEVIGGDCVNSIQRRLLGGHQFPSAEVIYQARIDAEDRFEVKVEIIQKMTVLHPEGDWARKGAWALENTRSTTGEYSLDKLYQFLQDLQKENAVRSPTFRMLKNKVFLRINSIDEGSEIH